MLDLKQLTKIFKLSRDVGGLEYGDNVLPPVILTAKDDPGTPVTVRLGYDSDSERGDVRIVQYDNQ
jgi:hypothetical protein